MSLATQNERICNAFRTSSAMVGNSPVINCGQITEFKPFVYSVFGLTFASLTGALPDNYRAITGHQERNSKAAGTQA